MSTDQNLGSKPLETQLEEFSTRVWAIAQQYQEDSQTLLVLLRMLEQLHREIREEMFVPSLPNRRQPLYDLLKDIEEMGGWPYIERMKLQAFLESFLEESSDPEASTEE
ncbi:MAG: hypothetical protein ACOC3E_02955 [Cyanobacteriota bacterium]